jgi:undecaprenyl-diphosphatase
MFGLIGVFWWRASRSMVERATILPAVGLVVLLTCLGRVRLGTHWPSDIIAGLVIGLVWLAALGLAVVLAERAGRMRVA